MRLKKVKDAIPDIGYVLGKLEEIHSDVKELKIQVDVLRQESAARKAVTKFIVGALSVGGAVLGWVLTHILGK
jgi:hypothetical protein